ncbi:MAG: hypothetical protein BJ554DRAFT_609 [Olpidium bornovanus]|uniref:Uncharacterized protein n=1 Tax=Olpidium bornovanus TaxID=278681 RepID=A0A8H8DI11_9FUNG|nr:MAG: hypothetical protein BJ554DRAFT_609 [Olpidium bornovanus]
MALTVKDLLEDLDYLAAAERPAGAPGRRQRRRRGGGGGDTEVRPRGVEAPEASPPVVCAAPSPAEASRGKFATTGGPTRNR